MVISDATTPQEFHTDVLDEFDRTITRITKEKAHARTKGGQAACQRAIGEMSMLREFIASIQFRHEAPADKLDPLRTVASRANALLNCVKREPSGMWFVKPGRNSDYNAAFDAIDAGLGDV